MRHVIYILKIPIPDKPNEYEEFKVDDPKKICEKLKISITCFNRIVKGTFKCSHSNKKYLEGIIIEREYQPLKKPSVVKKTEEEIAKEKEEFRKNIINDMKTVLIEKK